jgi:hypothetical protein
MLFSFTVSPWTDKKKKKLVDLKMLSLLYLQLLNGAVNSETLLGRYTAEF